MAARVRAALAYADIDIKAAQTRVGISRATMTRIVSPTAPRGVRPEELPLIIEATGVPAAFFEVGFDPLEQPLTDVEIRVIDIERRVKALETRNQAQAFADELADRLEHDELAPDEEVLAIMRAAHRTLSILAASPSSGSTPGEGDATPGSPQAPGEGKRRSGRRRAS